MFISGGSVDNKLALVQAMMSWHWSGNDPLTEPVLTKSHDINV